MLLLTPFQTTSVLWASHLPILHSVQGQMAIRRRAIGGSSGLQSHNNDRTTQASSAGAIRKRNGNCFRRYVASQQLSALGYALQ